MHIDTHTYTSTHTHRRTNIHAHIHKHTHLHTDTRGHTHTDIHTHTHRPRGWCGRGTKAGRGPEQPPLPPAGPAAFSPEPLGGSLISLAFNPLPAPLPLPSPRLTSHPARSWGEAQGSGAGPGILSLLYGPSPPPALPRRPGQRLPTPAPGAPARPALPSRKDSPLCFFLLLVLFSLCRTGPGPRKLSLGLRGHSSAPGAEPPGCGARPRGAASSRLGSTCQWQEAGAGAPSRAARLCPEVAIAGDSSMSKPAGSTSG